MPKKHAQTARYPLSYEESDEESDQESTQEAHHKASATVQAKTASFSAPCTVRRPAPCAVVYPSTSTFIEMVHRLGIGLDAEETKPPSYYLDGCCTVSSIACSG